MWVESDLLGWWGEWPWWCDLGCHVLLSTVAMFMNAAIGLLQQVLSNSLHKPGCLDNALPWSKVAGGEGFQVADHALLCEPGQHPDGIKFEDRCVAGEFLWPGEVYNWSGELRLHSSVWILPCGH